MAVKIRADRCSGCGACLQVCLFNALALQDGKVSVDENVCTFCGACGPVCPQEAIRHNELKLAAQDSAVWRDVWVYIEGNGPADLHGVSLELLGIGRALADAGGQRLAAVVCSDGTQEWEPFLFSYGADLVYYATAPGLQPYTTEGHASALSSLAAEYKPATILLGATANGRDLAPRVAARLQTGLTADCTAVAYQAEEGRIIWTRPAFGGNIMATIVSNRYPQMGTVRPGIFKRPQQQMGRGGTLLRQEVTLPPSTAKILQFRPGKLALAKLEEASVIIAGGRGMGSAENFQLLQQLADAMGGVVAASRAAVDAGWQSHVVQVGQSGKAVGPKLYLACGISGAVQHLAGIGGADIVVAVNKDPEAPIFRVADIGIVGDVLEIIPALIRAVEEIKRG
nr:FAD-binding protein [uncultured Anaeromusa sp.]